jgi:hypothetical protein
MGRLIEKVIIARIISPIEIIIDSLYEFSTVIERDWTQDGTTNTQDNRFRLAALKIREAVDLLEQNNEEFKRGMQAFHGINP